MAIGAGTLTSFVDGQKGGGGGGGAAPWRRSRLFVDMNGRHVAPVIDVGIFAPQRTGEMDPLSIGGGLEAGV